MQRYFKAGALLQRRPQLCEPSFELMIETQLCVGQRNNSLGSLILHIAFSPDPARVPVTR